MPLIELKKDGNVYIIIMNNGENRFNPSFIDAMNQALDKVEKCNDLVALVTTGGEQKFYSNGLDLKWLSVISKTEKMKFMTSVAKLFARMITFPMPTVAAINGHAFASGALLAFAHDFRIMRIDRGFICMPEIDIKIPLTPGLLKLIRARVSESVFRDLILRGIRFGGNEAKKVGLVDDAVDKDEVLPRSIALAASLATKDKNIYGILKRMMFGEVAILLENESYDELANYI